MSFHYTSIQSHGIITPDVQRIKETRVNVENGKGKKTVTIKDEKGTHSDTMALSKKEIKNIQGHKFMPELFHKPTQNVKRKKTKTMKHTSKKDTRKSKK